MNTEALSCTGKVRFTSKAQAKRSAKIVSGQRGIRGLKPYECEFCTLWHLGHGRGKATHLRRGSTTASPAG